MFSKSLCVFLLAVCLIQPNDAIFGIDTAIQSATIALFREGNNIIQNASFQALSLLIGLQTAVQKATNNLNTEIVGVLNAAITTGVSVAGGSQTLIASCTQKSQGTLTAFQIGALNRIINNCIINDLAQTIRIISSISGSANTITNTVLNANSTVAAACPPPAAGDIIASINNGACILRTKTMLTEQVVSQGINITSNALQASAIVTSLASFTAVIPTCVTAQLGLISVDAIPVITPIIKCSMAL